MKKLLYLLLSCMAILVFVFMLAPAITNSKYLKKKYQFIERAGIDTTPLFYSESEQARLRAYRLQKQQLNDTIR